MAATEAWQTFEGKNIYDVSKHVIDCVAAISGADFYALRFGTVNGWSPNFRLDLMINRMVFDAVVRGEINVMNEGVHRAILDIRDLCRAVTALIAGEPSPGAYNLCSFNGTVGEIASHVAQATGATLNRLGRTQTYDFCMSNAKLCGTYDFAFEGSVGRIVDELLENFDRETYTRRPLQPMASLTTRKRRANELLADA